MRPDGQRTSTQSTDVEVPRPKCSRGSPADWKLPPPVRWATLARPAHWTVTLAPIGVPVGCCTLQTKRQEVASLGLVVEEGQRLVLRDNQGVDPAVVIQIARGQPAPIRKT